MDFKILKDKIDKLLIDDEADVVSITKKKIRSQLNLEILIDKPKGVTFEDCERVSRKIDSLLDELDPFETPYFLEVGSCGLDRNIKKTEDFNRHIGEEFDIKKRGAIEKIRGILNFVDEDKIIIMVEDEEHTIKREDITKATISF